MGKIVDVLTGCRVQVEKQPPTLSSNESDTMKGQISAKNEDGCSWTLRYVTVYQVDVHLLFGVGSLLGGDVLELLFEIRDSHVMLNNKIKADHFVARILFDCNMGPQGSSYLRLFTEASAFKAFCSHLLYSGAHASSLSLGKRERLSYSSQCNPWNHTMVFALSLFRYSPRHEKAG